MKFSFDAVSVIIGFVAIGVLVLLPLGYIFSQTVLGNSVFFGHYSFVGLTNFVQTLRDPLFLLTMANTAEFVIGVTVTTIIMGFLFAILFARIEFPLSRLLRVLIISPIFLSPLSLAIGWVYVAAPGGPLGYIWSSMTGTSPPWNLYSLTSLITINSIWLVPITFLILSPPLSSIDSGYLEMVRICGGNFRQTVQLVTIPMVRNALIYAVLLVVLESLEQFSVPLILGSVNGFYLGTTFIDFLDSQAIPAFGEMAVVSVLLVVFGLILIAVQRRFSRAAQRYATLKTGFRAAPKAILPRRYTYLISAVIVGYVLLAFPIPMFGVFYRSIITQWIPYVNQFKLLTLSNYLGVLGSPYISGSLVNTILVSTFAATIGVALTFIIAYAVRKSHAKGSSVLDSFLYVPMAIPGITMGLGYLFVWSRAPLPIYGTIWIIVMAYISRYIPLGAMTISGGMIQVHSDLEESYRVIGGSSFSSLRRILIPLIKPAIIAAWVLLFVHFTYEIATSYLLYSYGSQVSSVVMFQLYQSDPGELAALSLLQFLLVLLIFIPLRKYVSSNFVAVSE